MEGYYDVTVVIEGAVDEDATFPETDEGMIGMDQMIDSLRIWAKQDKINGIASAEQVNPWVQIFTLYHAHPLSDEECSCAQYVTDHHPEYEWNAPEEGR
jgi:hypothetical protein